jgi:hypothetical protein
MKEKELKIDLYTSFNRQRKLLNKERVIKKLLERTKK